MAIYKVLKTFSTYALVLGVLAGSMMPVTVTHAEDNVAEVETLAFTTVNTVGG